MRYANKITFAILVIALVIPSLALAGSATLHWQANTEADLAGYRIYYGTSSRSYGAPISVDKNTTSYTLNNLTDGQTYYFALTAVDTSGNESGYSQEVSKYVGSSGGDSNQSGVVVLSSIPAEAGTLMINHEWKRVEFCRNYNDPVVVAGPLSYNGRQPCGVRIRTVTQTGFEIRIQEWEYLDQWHKMENVSYLVLEKGHYTLPDGTEIEAGKIVTDKANPHGEFSKVQFSRPFQNQAPIVISTVQTVNGPQMVVMRERNISHTGFELVMSEQENSDAWHKLETIGYIAWGPGAGTVDNVSYRVGTVSGVDNNWTTVNYSSFPAAPILLMGIQTAGGLNTANIRFRNKGNRSVDIFLSEETSLDSETWHIQEVVGYIALK